MTRIRKAKDEDLDTLMELFEQGKRIMRKNGNLKQWTNGYPEASTVLNDIAHGNCYICQDGQGEAIGTFAFIPGEEPTYARIYRGQWLDDTLPYATIHRLASTEDSHGVAAACIDWCCRRMPNLRADTHQDNHILHTHPAETRVPLLRHHLLRQRGRAAGLPENTALAFALQARGKRRMRPDPPPTFAGGSISSAGHPRPCP